MAMVINTNVSSLTAQRNLAKTGLGLETAMARLSSGLRINRPRMMRLVWQFLSV